ncbi:hypothetical protein SEA_OBLADI_134 [Gordonia phage ObLaDi]|uniref:Uncharacterized protein n=3 Tax=Cafassovirus TaxID=3425056 RepID=A0A9E7TVJ3_9CAUD|nr:hypothetical protein SEA_CAFASSO_135 [Gordonia phage Cafasso]UVK59873.1 hypothetical protein SEA_ALEEMILY_133 [Gordonia phage Aleemily]UXE03857.1 hypothetical protein SEA_OBLADI_134 [Gordonia phage ObLaDi]
MTYTPTQPVATKWLPPHADTELTPALRAGYRLESFPEGPGARIREVDMRGLGPEKVATLWTNDADGCDIVPVEPMTDLVGVTRLVLTLRVLREHGLSATEVFDRVAATGSAIGAIRTKAPRTKKAPTPEGAGARRTA